VLWTTGVAATAARPPGTTTVHDLQGGSTAAGSTVVVGPEPIFVTPN
jgi:hypothetical protein